MAYLTPADFLARLPPDDAASLSTLDPSAIAGFVSDACALADSYIGVSHDLPLTVTPAALPAIVYDVARFLAFGNHPSEAVKERHSQAITWLTGVADQTISLGISLASGAPDTEASFTVAPRMFSRQTLAWDGAGGDDYTPATNGSTGYSPPSSGSGSGTSSGGAQTSDVTASTATITAALTAAEAAIIAALPTTSSLSTAAELAAAVAAIQTAITAAQSAIVAAIPSGGSGGGGSVPSGVALTTDVTTATSGIETALTAAKDAILAALPSTGGLALTADVSGAQAAIIAALPSTSGLATETAVEAAIAAAKTAILSALPSTTGLATEAAVEAAISAAQSAILAAIPTDLAGLATETAVEAAITAAKTAILTALPSTAGLATGANVTAAQTAIIAALPSTAGLATETAVETAITTAKAAILAALPSTAGLATETAVEAAITAAKTAILTALPSTAGLATGANVTASTAAIQGTSSSNTLTTIAAAIASLASSIASAATAAAVSTVQTTVTAIQAALITTAQVLTQVTTGLTNYGAAKTSDVTAAVTSINGTAGVTNTGLQGADATATLTGLKTSVAALPTTAQYTSGQIAQFALSAAPTGWTQVSGTTAGVLSKGFTYSQRLSSISSNSLNTAYGTACTAAYAPGTTTTVLYYYQTSLSNTNFQIYNPATDTWSTVATGRPVSLNVSYVNTMVTLPSGAILTLGNGSNGLALYSFQPSTSTWTSLATTSCLKGQGVMVLDAAGANVFVFGGAYNASASNAQAIQSYSISGNSWTTKSTTFATAVSNICYVAACLLPSGKMLLIDLNAWTYAVYNPSTDAITTASKAVPFTKPASMQLAAPLSATTTGAILFSEVPGTYTESGDTWASSTSTWGPVTLNNVAPTIAGYGTYVMGLPGGSFYLYASGSVTTTVTCSKN